MPNHAHKPTAEKRKRVETFVSLGIDHSAIAKLEGIDKKTLYKYYREELDLGAVRANAAVAQKLFALAMKGDRVACIVWLNNRAGWVEEKYKLGQDVRLTTHDGDKQTGVAALPATKAEDVAEWQQNTQTHMRELMARTREFAEAGESQRDLAAASEPKVVPLVPRS